MFPLKPYFNVIQVCLPQVLYHNLKNMPALYSMSSYITKK